MALLAMKDQVREVRSPSVRNDRREISKPTASMSVAGLAFLTGLSKRTIRRIFFGTSVPSLVYALVIAHVLGRSVEDLFAAKSSAAWVRNQR
jgi:DNA-binding XRE family transcriptional regulator